MRCAIRLAIIFLLASSATGAPATQPYDVIERAFAPHMPADDALAFPLKVKTLAGDRHTFWRGTKDPFFDWCKSATADWFADRDSYVPAHGDLHLGNIGTYATSWGALAFGMVDFDDAASLPFQVELLEGLISLQLAAAQNKIQLDGAKTARVAQTLVDAYRSAVESDQNATDLLLSASEPLVEGMLQRRERPYEQELDQWTAAGKFKSLIYSGKGELREILRPAPGFAKEAAGALAQAVANSPEMKSRVDYSTAAEFRDAILDVRQRTRLGSAGSQGLAKYVILLRRPIRGVQHDAILYFKQVIPAAAERAGMVPPAPKELSPGRRAKEIGDQLMDPAPFLSSWCDISNVSYWVTLKEPWSAELDARNVRTAEELLRVARIWGGVAGAAHRGAGGRDRILARLNPELVQTLQTRADSFVRQLDEDFERFRADSRVVRCIERADAAIADLSSAAPHPATRP